jgi:hypothetical protein
LRLISTATVVPTTPFSVRAITPGLSATVQRGISPARRSVSPMTLKRQAITTATVDLTLPFGVLQTELSMF